MITALLQAVPEAAVGLHKTDIYIGIALAFFALDRAVFIVRSARKNGKGDVVDKPSESERALAAIERRARAVELEQLADVHRAILGDGQSDGLLSEARRGNDAQVKIEVTLERLEAALDKLSGRVIVLEHLQESA